MNMKTFHTLREAEDFVNNHLRYASGKCKKHLIYTFDGSFDAVFGKGNYAVFWEGRLIRAGK